jgi:hypothetical protein
MLNIKKQNVMDDDNNIVSVILDYKDYLRLAEAFENYCIAKLIDENSSEDYLTKDAAMDYYSKQKDMADGN